MLCSVLDIEKFNDFNPTSTAHAYLKPAETLDLSREILYHFRRDRLLLKRREKNLILLIISSCVQTIFICNNLHSTTLRVPPIIVKINVL